MRKEKILQLRTMNMPRLSLQRKNLMSMSILCNRDFYVHPKMKGKHIILSRTKCVI